MAPDGESFRGLNAVRLLSKGQKYTLDKIIADGYDTKLSIFEVLIPALLKSFDQEVANGKTQYSNLKEPIAILREWNYYAAENSVATTLANEWAFKLNSILRKTYTNEGESDQVENTIAFAKNAKPTELLPQLQEVIKELNTKFGSWQIPWGSINRFQRQSGEIDLAYNDNASSLPIAYASSLWGSLPAFKSNYQDNTIKRYGSSGNSFVCAVEFGPKIKAKSLLAGGNSGNPSSKHFDDQSVMYQNGQFKDVLFYKEDVLKNAERNYHPGE
jgi:acyl-homoserine lactone acylase PvdQ